MVEGFILERKVNRLVILLSWILLKRRWLSHSLAYSHDLLELELPGAWKPLDSSNPQETCEGQKARFSFPNGN
jgi:hypothetical protein